MNKTAIKNFAVWARNKLIADITYKAGLIGVGEKGIAQPLPQSTSDLQFFDIGTKEYVQIAGKTAINQRNALVDAIKRKEQDSDYKTAFAYIIEEVAYTWFNRLVAIRFMEVNDYLPSRIRVLSSENPAKKEPDFVTTPFDTDLEFTAGEQEEVLHLKDENKLDELFRMLFIKQCNKLHEILPELFEKTDDYTELLLTISFTDEDGVVYHLVRDIPENDFNVEKESQVEIIGWLYQYYNTELKDETFALLKKNVKITKERIPAATQLFTPDWIVRYMVENSLGRLWVEGHPNDDLKANWKYYLEEAEQEPDVVAQLEKIRAEYKTINPEDIKVIDPCMGSGHILVYCFDVLMQIYESQGYTGRDAAQSILKNNLYGLDIDKRAAQLAYFAVMMKARQYDRRIFERGISPRVYAIQESNEIDEFTVEYFANGNARLKADIDTIIREMHDAKEYGSILQITQVDFAALYARFEEVREDIHFGREAALNHLLPLVQVAEALAQKYDVVVTNPPYMGASGMGAKLAKFVKDNYPDSKSDLSTVCMEKTLAMCKENGYMSMINIPVWMFLSSFENMRKNMLTNNTITTMAHPGRGIFGSDFGTTSFVFAKRYISDYKGVYCRLFDAQGEVKSIEERELAFLSGKGRYTAQQSNFSKIPGSPVAYWVSKSFVKAFEVGKIIGDFSTVSEGVKTGDNARFLRLWQEIDATKFSFAKDNKGFKWYPHHKGGDYRKWYGNLEYAINWENDGAEIRCSDNSGLQGKSMYFNEFASWSKISSKGNPLRYYEKNILFDSGAPALANNDIKLCLALFNTVVGRYYLQVISPTLNLQVGDVKALPLIMNNKMDPIVDDCIRLSKTDWDSFETSWGFTCHPMVRPVSTIAQAYTAWEAECNNRFNQLKANEEELNRIFIDIYCLQDELPPEVEDKDVTVRRADLQRDVRSLLSYAVGCMFGRYSLDVDGLAYAGGEWDNSKYTTFLPDNDNCIPITDEEYFEDDIVELLCVWLKKVYGADTLEENLNFIADALGGKGKTSREVIRNYFLKDFFKDHCKIYQKRPIYWLFDSGKQNGFKALVYMHRWNADTVGNLRVEYLHRLQRVYDSEIGRMQEIMDNSHDNREISAAGKRKEKLQKQLKETKDYDAQIAHIALSRIDIDLDDGVKVNYEKVQTAPDGKVMKILAKI